MLINMNDNLKVAMIGLGAMGSTHYNLLREMNDVEIIALVDVEAHKVEEKALECNACAFTDINEMLSCEKPDFVIICTPSYLHAEHAIAVMNNGIHVLSEKPAALNEDDIVALYSCADETNVFYMVANVLRFWPEYIWLKENVISEQYGKLMNLQLYRQGEAPKYSWQNWMMDIKRSGLVPFDLHIHDIDMMIYLLGKPDNVSPYESKGVFGQYIETTCEYKSGTRVQARAAWYNCPVPFHMGYEAVFENGNAVFVNDKLNFYSAKGEIIIPDMKASLSGSEINVANMSGYYREIRYFIDCIKNSKKPSIISKDELLIVNSILKEYLK